MTLIEKDADWPVARGYDNASQMFKPVDVSLTQIVAEGISEWMYKSGRKPTDVIFGRKACALLRDETDLARAFAVANDQAPTNQYHGLTFHRDFDAEGVVLLTREPQ